MWAINQVHKSDRVSFLRDARDYALLNGLVLRYDSLASDNCVAHIPLTAFPSSWPQKLYQECLDLQPTVNKLMMHIANDPNFINQTLGPIVEVDEFTRNLLSIENTVRREGRAQPIMSCICRADYMLDKAPSRTQNLEDLRVRQVEVNAIASGMAAHSFNLKSLHKFLMNKYNIAKIAGVSQPENESLALVVNGLIDAYDSYGKSSAQILLVAEDERSLNFSDHVLIELAVHRRRSDIRFVRRRFNTLPSNLRLGPNKELLLEDVREIAVVYFRYGYDPSNYNFAEAWQTRLLLERSKAIKCPSMNFHLSGAKKFQQVLNSRDQLERYLSADEASRMENVFCKFWSIESELGDGYKMATTAGKYDKLVLKPQREGGGHNIFGKDIKPYVKQLTNSKTRSQYILMEYIDGPREGNLLLLHGDKPENDAIRWDEYDQLVSELGIFGSILANENSTILSNRAAGYLVRSKKFGVNEGGVAAGYAGISNLVLLNDGVADLAAYYEQ